MTAPDSPPASPPPSGWTVDRRAAERDGADLMPRLRTAADTRVLVVSGDRAPLDGDHLALVPVDAVPADAEWAFLGRDDAGAALVLAAFDADRDEPVPAPTGWGALRTVAARLPAAEAGVLVTGVALGRWLRDARYCPACGSETELRNAGWSRHCPSCGREHFPRTDPAVIVAVTSVDGERLLLGSNALWDADRYSCFAGFAEAGESLEDTVLREVQEESGVRVHGLSYRGSQAWPYSRSLMLGFRAVAAHEDEAEPDGEEILDVRWFTRDEIRSSLAGAGPVTLPGAASIAHRLLTEWLAERPS